MRHARLRIVEELKLRYGEVKGHFIDPSFALSPPPHCPQRLVGRFDFLLAKRVDDRRSLEDERNIRLMQFIEDLGSRVMALEGRVAQADRVRGGGGESVRLK